MPDEIKGPGIIQNRIPQIMVSGLHCACPNGRMTNDELFKSALEYGLKDIGTKAFRFKGKQHETLQSRKPNSCPWENRVRRVGRRPKSRPSIHASRRAYLMNQRWDSKSSNNAPKIPLRTKESRLNSKET